MATYLYLQTQKWNPLSIGIRFITRGIWSHAGIFSDKNIAKPFLSAQGLGVKWRKQDKKAKMLFFKVPNIDKVLAAMESQVGKPYDFGAIFGILLDRDWRDTSKWFCSELVAWACEQAGTPLLNTNFQLNRVFPNLLGASLEVQLLTEEEKKALPAEVKKWAV